MATEKKDMDLSNFFSAAEGRLDRWRTLHRIAKTLVGVAERDAEALRQEAQKLLADMGPIEDFCGYPGPRLMAQLHERLQTGDWTGFARLVQRISNGLMTNSYRDNTEAWKAEEETEVRSTDVLPPSIGRGQSRKPYFEVLMVSPGERSMWPEIRRRLPATAPRRGPVRLRTGHRRQLRGRCPRNRVQLQPAGSRDQRRIRVPLSVQRADTA